MPPAHSVADYIERNRERLVDRYLHEAAKLDSARGLQPSELIDTFPEFLDRLISISREGRRHPDQTRKRLEETHLSLRLRQGYAQDEVTSEYVLMGRLFTELWEGAPADQQPSAADVQLLFDTLDEAMAQVVAVFSGYSIEDRQREKRILRRLDALAPSTLQRGADLGSGLKPLVELVQESIDAEGGELLLLDEAGRQLERAVVTGAHEGWASRAPLPLDGDSFPAVLARSEEARFEIVETGQGNGWRTHIGQRLWPHGVLLGVLWLSMRKPEPIQPRTRRLLETLVEYLSGILERALLFEEIRKEVAARDRLEMRLRLATHAATDAIWDRDLQTNTIEWSEGAELLFGYRREQLGSDLSWFEERIHPEDRERVIGSMRELLEGAGERCEIEYRFRRLDDRYVLVTDHWVVERDRNGGAIRMVGAMKDVSTERAAVRGLRESEERYRLAVRAADLGTWDFDPATGEGLWDERARKIYGFERSALVTWDTLLERIDPRDRPQARAALERAHDPNGTGEYDLEYRILCAQGQSPRWVRATGRTFFENGRPVRFIGTSKDITHLRAVQEALARSEHAFRTLAEAMPQIVFTARPDGELDYINQRLAEYSGLPIEKALGWGWLEISHPEVRPKVVEAWTRALSLGEPYEVEQNLRRRDGVYRWHLTRAVPLRDEVGRIEKWLGTSTDIDDLKRAETDLRRRSEFEQQLIGIVSHDLRNPLNAILLSAQTLLRSEELSDRQARSVARILTAAERATRLTRELLDFTRARLGSGIPVERQQLDFHRTVRHVLDEAELAHPERTITYESSGDGKGFWDSDRLAQIVTNLVDNAIAYSPENSVIRVETRGGDGEVLLRVHNEGAPIAPELMPQIFSPLFRGTAGESNARSIGLGLFIVHSIAVAHGGTIEVESTASDGTTFTVRLPRSA